MEKTKQKQGAKAAAGVYIAETGETPAAAKRGIKRPTPELAELIRMVNLVPEDVLLPQLHPGPWRYMPIESVDLEEEFGDLPGEVQLYLRERYEALSDDIAARNQFALDTYEQIRRGRELLYAFIDRYQKCSPLIPFSIDNEPAFLLGGGHVQVVREKTRLGTIRRAEVRISPFGKAIDGAEVDYIRRCKACSKVFFAGRENQPCCSEKCAKSRRQKRWRDKRKEGYYQGANLTNKGKRKS